MRGEVLRAGSSLSSCPEPTEVISKMTGTYFFLVVISLSCLWVNVVSTPEKPYLSYDFLYNEGVSKYQEENWEECVKNLEDALSDWHWWKENMAKCREDCHNKENDGPLLSVKLQEEDRFYETTVRTTLCIIKCKKSVFGSRMDRVVEEDVDEYFEMRKPYDYLQLCYFKLDMIKEAADAAATVLVAQPEHEVMQNNLKYYIAEGGISPESVVNRELKEYGNEYILGTIAYNQEDYAETINHMEKSLVLYFRADQECRRLCENSIEQKILEDFVMTVANQYTYTIRCKRRCNRVHGNLLGETIDNFLASYFNYMQFAYFKENKLEEACEAVASSLLLDPEDPVQQRNKQYYLSNEDVTEDMFVPRESVVAYKDRMDYERDMLDFIETNFVFLDDDVLEDIELEDEVTMGIRVSMTDEELGGSERMVADGFASPSECHILTELTKMTSVEGDGYKKSTSPHTAAENFQGVTLGRTGLMVHANLIAKEVLELILDVTNHCRDYLERYFNLLDPLYFSFTHLVCRTARPEKAANRSSLDLSHEVHVDNCILQNDGNCLRVPPAYVFRDYSAILYLNQEFEGGEFIFTHDRTGSSYESKIKPRCGRMVGFSAGPENPHGVLPVHEGSRCAIGMWFTHDKRYKEVERIVAETLLRKLQNGEI
ncbi:prolyl 3-hydroxylase 1-like isoform X2 [Penaeus japonicus]|uniref:prolyl 3-hydroxylase 1-like isoform X2 n=1 Tax=Penaeus japonicus TaxID=27405 RepID=UPI001C70F4F5|nr:prolyl 3-hydroxylase 1-like isoform X2 [Penaeus japonicus]